MDKTIYAVPKERNEKNRRRILTEQVERHESPESELLYREDREREREKKKRKRCPLPTVLIYGRHSSLSSCTLSLSLAELYRFLLNSPLAFACCTRFDHAEQAALTWSRLFWIVLLMATVSFCVRSDGPAFKHRIMGRKQWETIRKPADCPNLLDINLPFVECRNVYLAVHLYFFSGHHRIIGQLSLMWNIVLPFLGCEFRVRVLYIPLA